MNAAKIIFLVLVSCSIYYGVIDTVLENYIIILGKYPACERNSGMILKVTPWVHECLSLGKGYEWWDTNFF